jgi:hypothetical protein
VLDAIPLMDVDVILYLDLLSSTILLHRVRAIRGRQELRQLGWLFGYTCRRLMRILVRDGERRMIGIGIGQWLGVGRIVLAVCQCWAIEKHHSQRYAIRRVRRKDRDIQVDP